MSAGRHKAEKLRGQHRKPIKRWRAARAGGVAVGAGAIAISMAGATDAAQHGPKYGEHRNTLILKAMEIVKKQKGEPYIYGAEGPNAFDCSGLTSYAFGKVGLSLPRTANDQSQSMRRIPRSQVKRGDFVFWYSGGSVYHVAVLAGHWLHTWSAPHTGTVVQRQPMWSAPHFYGTLRLT